ncbi:hypothetical protein [Streptomyces sp. NPDC050264]|uniref:P-loop NTPase n=1 Tax=Streptomyces sp. NPDC050264 TaxID=3155038 RepID=UPI00341FE1CD
MSPRIRSARSAGLTASAIGTGAVSGALAAGANFVTVPWAAGLGASAGAVALYSGLAWQRRVDLREAGRAWHEAVAPGPDGSGPDDSAARGSSVLAALNPDREVVPYSPLHGSHLREVVRWCGETGRGPVWRVAGPAGAGKTRLLIEAARQLKQEGWACGWVRRGRAADAVAAAGLRPGGVLLIVDDADTLPDHGDLAAMLTDAVRGDYPLLRIVLGGRDFGGWWRDLRAGLDPAVHAAVTPSGPTWLTGLTGASADRQQLFANAARRYAAFLDRPVPSTTLTGPHAGATFAELHAAAAAAAERGLTGAFDLSTALDHLFSVEESWWAANAADAGITHPPAVLHAAVTVATLLGARDCEQTARRLACLPGLTTTPFERLTELALWLRQLYAQRSGTWLDPHLPARIAERYAARCAARQPGLPSALATAALTA